MIAVMVMVLEAITQNISVNSINFVASNEDLRRSGQVDWIIPNDARVSK